MLHDSSKRLDDALTEPGHQSFESLREQVAQSLTALTAFWRERACDPRGGFRTCFDAEGQPLPDETEQYLVSQTRVAWTLAELARRSDDRALLEMAATGAADVDRRFWDPAEGGWYWKVAADGGVVLDDAKIVYGQSFAIYSFASLGRLAGDHRLVQRATETFDLLQVHASDAAHGGYFENFLRDWRLAPGGSAAGDRKSLDVHTHLLESYTELALSTGEPTHRRRLAEVEALVIDRMVDPVSGAAGNQYAPDFSPLDPIVIDRTWIAERVPDPTPLGNTVSYGHNVELGWLIARADDALGDGERAHIDLLRKLTDYVLRFGLDTELGGIYREGPPEGPASDLDKEFWQNCEALIGFLNAYRLTEDPEYWHAFASTWAFARRFLIHPVLGEWRTRTTRDGRVLDPNLGNYWTGAYHTGRALVRCMDELDQLTGRTGTTR
jgi:cellobiose epimerase